MAETNLIRDHHLLTRNLKLNGKYLSNDGDDEGISIGDTGLVTVSGDLDIASNMTISDNEIDIKSGDFLLDVTGDITLDVAGQNIYLKGGIYTVFDFNIADNSMKIMSISDDDDYCKIHVGAAGTTTISTIDNAAANADLTLSIDGNININSAASEHITLTPGGEVVVDKDLDDTTAGSITALKVDLDRVGTVSSGTDYVTGINLDVTQTGGDGGAKQAIGLNIDVDGDNNHAGSSIAYGIYLTNDGAEACYGIYIKNEDDAAHFDFINVSSASVLDYFAINTIAEGATTISTVDNDTAVAHLTLDVDGDINIEADGHVEFDGCGVGFDKETTTFAVSAVIEEGDDSTDIDFRLGNKHELTLDDNIGGSGENINMIFPATSGNFILVLAQDASGGRTVEPDGWKAYASDASLADNILSANLTEGDVRWTRGLAPILSTAGKAVDLISIYWDADNQTALAVPSFGFETP